MTQDIWLKTIETNDLKEIWEISYGPKADLEWMKFNGPYFKDPVETWESFSTGYGSTLINSPMTKVIMKNQQIVGLVTAYWQDGSLKQWLEVGLLIYDANTWNTGIGSIALNKWLHELFQLYDYLPHIGFTTWSGNIGMQKVGEKNGMTKEGVIRNVRYWNGQYYDSIKFGILRTELLN